jgi:intraflagellar transport protein 172
VAYLWARSLGGDAASKLLSKLNLLESAIAFACDMAEFEFAFEVSKFADNYKLPDIHLRQAMHLEDEGQFQEAEAAFLLAQKPREAVLMYIHNEDWAAALAFANHCDPGSVADVLVEQAKALFVQGDFGGGEALLLQAQRPQLCIQLYTERNMWTEAIRFTKQYLPAKVDEVHREYDKHVAGSISTKADILAAAELLEQQEEYSRAIDMYLKLTRAMAENDDKLLLGVWTHAAALAIQHLADRAREVVDVIGRRIVELKRFREAGALFQQVGLWKEAIDAYVAAELWDEARTLVKHVPKYVEYVENQYRTHLKAAGKADLLVNVDLEAGLDAFAQRGDWDTCLETAAAQVRPVHVAPSLWGNGGEVLGGVIRDERERQVH